MTFYYEVLVGCLYKILFPDTAYFFSKGELSFEGGFAEFCFADRRARLRFLCCNVFYDGIAIYYVKGVVLKGQRAVFLDTRRLETERLLPLRQEILINVGNGNIVAKWDYGCYVGSIS